MTIFYMANILSLIGAIFLGISTFKNEKNNMIRMQIYESCFTSLSNLLLLNYGGVVACVYGIVRNTLVCKGYTTKNLTNILVAFCICIGLFFNKNGIIGFIPIISTVFYTYAIVKYKDAQKIRLALIINLSLWALNYAIIKSYPMFIMDVIIIMSSIFNSLAYYYKNKEESYENVLTFCKRKILIKEINK